MSKVKVLTVQFDVTGLPQEAIDDLLNAVCVQGEDLITENGDVHHAEQLRTNVAEVDMDDV
jgi:hypothetical protein